MSTKTKTPHSTPHHLTTVVKLCISILLLSIFLIGCNTKPHEEHRSLYTELKEVNKLVLSKMAIRKVGTIQDTKFKDAKGFWASSEALANSLKIGNRIGVFAYNTYIEAYIDLSQLREQDVEIDKDKKICTLYLPAIQTQIAGRDATLEEVYTRVSLLRSNITPSERAQLKEQMNSSLLRELGDKGSSFTRQLETSAKAKAKSYMTALLATRGYTAQVNIASHP